MTKKWIISCDEYKNNEKKSVFIIDMVVISEGHLFARGDIMELISKLDLEPDSFDHIYSGCDITRFSSDRDYDLSFFFADKSKKIYLSIICKNEEAKKKLKIIMQEFRDMEGSSIASEY